jgi:hypothetical protein
MFKVVWKPGALQDLASLWTAATSDDRLAITQACNVIDSTLRRDPDNEGESRPNNERIFFAPPLGIRFRVRHQSAVVSIYHVWRF